MLTKVHFSAPAIPFVRPISEEMMASSIPAVTFISPKNQESNITILFLFRYYILPDKICDISEQCRTCPLKYRLACPELEDVGEVQNSISLVLPSYRCKLPEMSPGGPPFTCDRAALHNDALNQSRVKRDERGGRREGREGMGERKSARLQRSRKVWNARHQWLGCSSFSNY